MLIQLGCKDVTTDVVSQEGPVSVKASQRDKKSITYAAQIGQKAVSIPLWAINPSGWQNYLIE